MKIIYKNKIFMVNIIIFGVKLIIILIRENWITHISNLHFLIRENSMNYKSILKDYVLPVILAIILAFFVRKFIIFQISVPSESMYPTIKIGDRIMVTRLYDLSKLKRGDIIVFDSKELDKPLIKRLIGLPGDKVTINKGTVYINGEKLIESYVVNNEDYSGSFDVPEGKYLFFGDNRADSFDARKWQNSYIDGEDIKGKARFIVYPFKRFGKFITGKDALTH